MILRPSSDLSVLVSVSFLNDLFEFDLATGQWADITSHIQGMPPSPRYDHTFASALGNLYLFGGLNEQGLIGL